MIALFEDDPAIIKALKIKLGEEIMPFVPLDPISITQAEVKKFVQSLRGYNQLVFLIGLECNYTYHWKISFLGLHFFQFLIQEYESSQHFNYFFYSFLSLEKINEINRFAFFIKHDKHCMLPFNYDQLINKSWQK